MRSRIFLLIAPGGWLFWAVGLARATIEKISGTARTASSDFFIVLTSRKTSYDVVGTRELLRTFRRWKPTRSCFFSLPEAGARKLTPIADSSWYACRQNTGVAVQLPFRTQNLNTGPFPSPPTESLAINPAKK